MRMPLLDTDFIVEVHAAAVALGLTASRDVLLGGVDRLFVAGLPTAPNPGAQLLSDLSVMNASGELADRAVPLEAWLTTAYALTRVRREAQVFRQALQSLAAARAGGPSGALGDAVPRSIPRILFLGANPSSWTRLAIEREVRDIARRLDQSAARGRVDVVIELAVRPKDLQEHLLRVKPAIVHFGGHGDEDGAIVLEDDLGRAAPVAPSALVGLFRILHDGVRCVVLNACFSEPQARAIAQHVDCVVGMSARIPDDSALVFATAFYGALGEGSSVRTAFDLGCNQIDLLGMADADVPRLLARPGVRPEAVFLAAGRRGSGPQP